MNDWRAAVSAFCAFMERFPPERQAQMWARWQAATNALLSATEGEVEEDVKADAAGVVNGESGPRKAIPDRGRSDESGSPEGRPEVRRGAEAEAGDSGGP